MNTDMIKKIRIALWMTQEQFANALKISQSAVSAFEIGRTRPRLSTMKKIYGLVKKHNIDIPADQILKSIMEDK